MADREITGWITVNHKHIPIYDGESKQDAINRAIAKDNEEKKAKDIEKNQKAADQASGKKSSTMVDGKDITDTFKRRPNEFDYTIEDILNAQGFDGKPQVVDAEEFDRIAAESGIVCQRTYSASDPETLNEYRNALRNGKFYTYCEGGNAYGQGMYAVATVGKDTKAMSGEMIHYMSLNNHKSGDTELTEQAKTDLIQGYIKDQGLTGDKARATEIFLRSQGFKQRPSSEDAKFVVKTLGNSGMNALKTEAFALEYSTGNAQHYIETFTLDKSAKIGYYYGAGHREDDVHPIASDRFQDAGEKAAALGYDAIRVGDQDTYYLVILNRTKCVFRKE